ncbi:MAG: SPFH domain-containing protein [Phycisphaerae bacterium]
MRLSRLIVALTGGALVAIGGGLLITWMVFRVYVPFDKCLVLIRKSGAELPAGQSVAGEGQKGILADTLGPGRYFINPYTYDTKLVDLEEISAGDPNSWKVVFPDDAPDYMPPKIIGKLPEVGVLVNRTGKPAPAGQEVVDAGFKGIQRDVLTPGTYRINPYVYEVRRVPAVIVPIGYCGVVTSQLGEMPGVEMVEEAAIGPDGKPIKDQPKVVQKLAAEGQRGVLKNVLQPGVYYLNPYVHKVQLVQVGYNEISQLKGASASDSITFPSKDGFNIDVEVTVVWGRDPEHAADMINRLGAIERIHQIILSQTRSICRNIGSEYESTDFIRGEKRELYQRAVTDTLKRVCREKDIDILIALIHNIEVHPGGAVQDAESADLKKTIQRGFIAREQDLTKQSQQKAAQKRAELETSKVEIDIARERISAETRLKVADIKAKARKQSEEIAAQRDLEVAKLERQIADLEAETTRVLGRATADVQRLDKQAEADGRRMLVEAFGGGRAFNLYTFAEKFEPESIRLIFAGEGTFWTDLSKLQDVSSMQLLKDAADAPKPAAPRPAAK